MSANRSPDPSHDLLHQCFRVAALPSPAVSGNGADGTEVVLSIVVPARDEAANLARLVADVHAAFETVGLPWELVIVDDGSADDTRAVLAAITRQDPRVRTVRLERPLGQTRALQAGFAVVRGDYIATLDADLQCAPADLPVLLAACHAADLACGIRNGRKDAFSRRLSSALSNAARRLLVAPAVRDLACPLRVFRRDALVAIARVTPLFDGAHRWLPALFVLAGLRVVQRPVQHHPRLAGESKYTTRGRVLPVLGELGHVIALRLRRSRRFRVVAGLALVGLVALVVLHGLGTWPLMEPDEGRNAEVAREMLESGRWGVPHFNGLPYLDKPVLLFWMIAIAFRAAGVGEGAARLPSALATIATMLLTYDLGTVLLGRRRGLVAALVLVTTPMVLAFARIVIFDSLLTALVAGALCCLVRARVRGNSRLWLPLAGLAMGAATLTKGPVGFAVPLIAWWAARGALPERPDEHRTWSMLAGIAVVILVVVPWLVVVERQQPHFLRYALFDETLLRLTSRERFHRGGPVYFYLATLPWALGAWSVVLAALAPSLVRRYRAGGRAASAMAFCVRAVVPVVIFFTLSASKRPHYVLPLLVPLSVLVAIALTAEPAKVVAAMRSIGRWAVLAGAATVLAVAAGFQGGGGTFALVSRHVMAVAGLFLVAWGATTTLLGRRPAAAIACGALFAPGLGLALLGPLAPYAEARSSRVLASYIEPGATVICFDTFRTSLPFYLRRPVVIASDTGRPLTSNYVVAQRGLIETGDYLVPMRALPDLLTTSARPVIVASRADTEALSRFSSRPLSPLYGDRTTILFQPKD
jgi:4-amino-4-deoxy-L-arabinose transferase-like glycosyltransferase